MSSTASNHCSPPQQPFRASAEHRAARPRRRTRRDDADPRYHRAGCDGRPRLSPRTDGPPRLSGHIAAELRAMDRLLTAEEIAERLGVKTQ
jgi:hypothetical protein